MIDLRFTLSKSEAQRLTQASHEAISAIQRVITEVALKIDREAKLLIARGPKTGRQYGKHQASAPGEAPATNTGRLIQSILWQLGHQGISAEVGSPLDYASYLETGTKRMAARPWLRPAYDKHIDAIVADVTQVLKKHL
jgi:hypothetical protein